MNYERMGIYVSVAVMVGVLGIAGISSGVFDLDLTSENKIPQITSSTNITPNAYYEWCIKMNFNCD